MGPAETFLDGSEFVLVAKVPRAGKKEGKKTPRWHQVHMNAEVMRRFFRLERGSPVSASFERVARDGSYQGTRTRQLVFSDVNKNPKIEFDLRDAPDYPDKPPLLVILEMEMRKFRYLLLMPDDPGYEEMEALNSSLERMGRGLPRVITNLAEVELRWPACPLRSPS
jgi:hypothetical protein